MVTRVGDCEFKIMIMKLLCWLCSCIWAYRSYVRVCLLLFFFRVQTRVMFLLAMYDVSYQNGCLQLSGIWFLLFLFFPSPSSSRSSNLWTWIFISNEQKFHFSVLLEVLCSWSQLNHDLLCDQKAKIGQNITAFFPPMLTIQIGFYWKYLLAHVMNWILSSQTLSWNWLPRRSTPQLQFHYFRSEHLFHQLLYSPKQTLRS